MIKYIAQQIEGKKYLSLIFIGLLGVLAIPLIINLFSWGWSYTGIGVGAVEGWLGYWGSYLGGILSALGVIGTTLLIIKRNDEAIEMQDKKARDKEYNFYELNQIEEAHKILVECGNHLLKINDLYRILAPKIAETMEFPIGKTMGNHDTKIYNELIEEYREIQREFSDYKSSYYGLLEQFEYKISLFSEVENEIEDLMEAINKYFIETHTIVKVLEGKDFKECKEAERDSILKYGIENVEKSKIEYFQKAKAVKIKLKSILLKKVDEYKKNKE